MVALKSLLLGVEASPRERLQSCVTKPWSESSCRSNAARRYDLASSAVPAARAMSGSAW